MQPSRRPDRPLSLSPAARVVGIQQARPLVIRFGAMGDIVLVTGLLHALHKRYGQACDVVGSGAWTPALLEAHPDVNSLFLVGSRRRPYPLCPDQWRLVDWLRQRPRGPVYVCDVLARDKVRWLLTRAGIPSGDCLFYDPAALPADTHWFDAWRWFAARAPANFNGPEGATDYPAAPVLRVPPEAQRDLEGFLSDRRITGPLILVQPGNKRSYKRGSAGLVGNDKAWPVERWASLCQRMLADLPEAHVLLCGVTAEQPLLQAIALAGGSTRIHPLGGKLPVDRLLALSSRAHSMVSVDTGPAHAAAAAGCPTVVLYGGTSPANWLPRGPQGTPVLALEPGEASPRRVDSIDVERVLEAWRALHPMPDCAVATVNARY